MEQHQDFNMYSKHTRAKIIVDTLFFKHKYLTSPIVTPKEKFVESSKIITDAVTANSKSTKSEQEAADKQPKNNSIKTYNKDPQPRVYVPQTRVESTTLEQYIEPQLILEFPMEAVVESLKRPIHNYISHDEE